VINFKRAFKNRDVEARLRASESRDDADRPGADDNKFGLAAQRLVPHKISISRPA
jgi:hypothetical protein